MLTRSTVKAAAAKSLSTMVKKRAAKGRALQIESERDMRLLAADLEYLHLDKVQRVEDGYRVAATVGRPETGQIAARFTAHGASAGEACARACLMHWAGLDETCWLLQQLVAYLSALGIAADLTEICALIALLPQTRRRLSLDVELTAHGLDSTTLRFTIAMLEASGALAPLSEAPLSPSRPYRWIEGERWLQAELQALDYLPVTNRSRRLRHAALACCGNAASIEAAHASREVSRCGFPCSESEARSILAILAARGVLGATLAAAA